MTSKKNFAIGIFDSDKINEINSIVAKHGIISTKFSSHVLFDTQPLNYDDITDDITSFTIDFEDENDLNNRLNYLIEELNQMNTEYSIFDSDTKKVVISVKFVGALDIKFDNIDIISKGTYDKIDELKLLKTEFGICKGYKPNFRPLEGQLLENAETKPETIYVFCNSKENLDKLKEILSEKIMEIDSNFELEYRSFILKKNRMI